MSKHTKGPWKADCYKRSNKCFVAAGERIIFEQVTEATENISPDAALIAAAPDLYHTLNTLLEELNAKGLIEEITVETSMMIVAALLKAEGK